MSLTIKGSLLYKYQNRLLFFIFISLILWYRLSLYGLFVFFYQYYYHAYH